VTQEECPDGLEGPLEALVAHLQGAPSPHPEADDEEPPHPRLPPRCPRCESEDHALKDCPLVYVRPESRSPSPKVNGTHGPDTHALTHDAPPPAAEAGVRVANGHRAVAVAAAAVAEGPRDPEDEELRALEAKLAEQTQQVERLEQQMASKDAQISRMKEDLESMKTAMNDLTVNAKLYRSEEAVMLDRTAAERQRHGAERATVQHRVASWKAANPHRVQTPAPAPSAPPAPVVCAS